jgi:hypothetical protein
MTSKGSALPRYSTWSDDELGALDVRAFLDLLHERAVDVGNELYDPDAYEFVDLGQDQYQANLTFYLRRRAWAEWYFGTVTPARQIALLPAEEVNLRLRLARQIKDEVRHHDVFCREIRKLRGEWRVDRFPAPSGLMEMHHQQFITSTAAELAAANQFSGEIVLLVQGRAEGNVLRHLLDESIMDAIEDIEADEPAYVAVGRDLVRRYATTPAKRRELADAQERFLLAQAVQHVADIEMLGARRVRPSPVFG